MGCLVLQLSIVRLLVIAVSWICSQNMPGESEYYWHIDLNIIIKVLLFCNIWEFRMYFI